MDEAEISDPIASLRVLPDGYILTSLAVLFHKSLLSAGVAGHFFK